MRQSECFVFLLIVFLQSVLGWHVPYHSEQHDHDEDCSSEEEYGFGHGYHTQHKDRYPYHFFNHGHYPHKYEQHHQHEYNHGAVHHPHQNGQYDKEKEKQEFTLGSYPHKNEYPHKQEDKHDFGFGYYPQFGGQYHKQGGHYVFGFGHYPQYGEQRHEHEGSHNFGLNQKEYEDRYPRPEEKYEPSAGQSFHKNEQDNKPQEDDISNSDPQTELSSVEADNIATAPATISTSNLENDNRFPNEKQNPIQGQTETSIDNSAQEETQTRQLNANAIQACKRRCPVTSEYNPLCATNNVTYTNPGRLDCAKACGEDANFLRFGPCTAVTSVTSTTSSAADDADIDPRLSSQ